MIQQLKIGVILAAATISLVGGCASQPQSSVAGNAGVVNSKCPIEPEDPINPKVTTDWKGKKVAFCCPGCIDEWDRKTDDQKAAALEAAK